MLVALLQRTNLSHLVILTKYDERMMVMEINIKGWFTTIYSYCFLWVGHCKTLENNLPIFNKVLFLNLKDGPFPNRAVHVHSSFAWPRFLHGERALHALPSSRCWLSVYRHGCAQQNTAQLLWDRSYLEPIVYAVCSGCNQECYGGRIQNIRPSLPGKFCLLICTWTSTHWS